MTEQHQQLVQNLLPHLTLELEQPVETEEHPNTQRQPGVSCVYSEFMHQRGRQHSQSDRSAEFGDVLGLPELFTKSHQGHTERMTENTKRLKNTLHKLRQRRFQKSHLSCVVKMSKKPLVSMRSSILTKGIDTLERQNSDEATVKSLK